MNWQVTGDLRIHIAGVLENSILAHCYTYSSRWVGTAIVSYYMTKIDSDLYYELIQQHVANHVVMHHLYDSWMTKGVPIYSSTISPSTLYSMLRNL